MDRSTLRRMIHADFESLLEVLTARQHVAPHEHLSQSLARAIGELGVCPNAVEQSLSWLQLDPGKSIGRLRRTELMQLARTVHRFWRHAAEIPAETSHPR
jgi:hypothetical protein